MPINELKVSAGYSKKNKTYFTAPIHQSIKLKSGQTFTFDSLEAGIDGNRLSFTVKPNNKRINRIRLKFSGMSYHNLFALQHGATVNREDGHYYLVFPRFQEVPKSLTFQMKGISYVTDQSLHFKIPGWNGKENDSSGQKKKVGEIMGSPLYFAGYSHDLHDPIPGQKIGLKFKWSVPDRVKNYAFLYLTPEKQLKEQLEHIPDEKERRRIIQQRTGILAIKNDKGKRPDFVRPRGASTIENTTTIGLLLNQQYVKSTDYLSITIGHLPNYKTINTKKIKLDIPNKGFIGN
ncbi:MAG TPA: hypothetical protein VFK33_02905 [Bacillales bacterium]|nr:hypothetical protein [Bacillales bacterium]